MGGDLNHNDIQRQILDAAAALLAGSYPVSRLRDGRPDELSEVGEFGAFALAVPEDRGGAGLSVVEEALVHVLLGRHLVSTRALATPIGSRVAAGAGRDDIAGQAAAGGTSVCAAVRSGGSILLIDPAQASLALVFGGRRLALMDIAGLPRDEVAGLGHSVPVARVRAGVPAIVAEAKDSGVLAAADLLVSAQLLGIAEAARDLAVSYAKLRQQFGKPIGAFQAIKHHCANMAVSAELLSAQLDMAAIAVRDGRADASFQVAALALLAPKVALANARTCIQVHGGIGFSAEADAHHYLKQAHVLRQLLNGASILDLPAPLAPYSSLAECN